MASSKRIPTPWRIRWRRFSRRVLPIVVFTGGALTAGWLWNENAAVIHAVGEVEAVRVDVAAANDGLLTSLDQSRTWALFDTVKAGETLARLDDRLLMLQLATLRSELDRLKADVDAEGARLIFDQAKLQHDHLRELARLIWKHQQRRLLVLDRRVLLETDRMELQRTNARVTRVEQLLAGKHISPLEVIEAQLLRDTIAARIDANTRSLSEEERQVQEAKDALAEQPEVSQPDIDQLLAPFRAAITTQESRINELHHSVESLTITAPFSGSIAAIHAWPGQRVRAGDPIVTVAATDGRYIVSYVRDGLPHPPAGASAVWRSRQQPRLATTSVVERVGSQVEPIPMHQLRDPRVPEWGFPVRLALRGPSSVVPGELVDISFASGSSPDR